MDVFGDNAPAPNSRFSQLRILLKPVVDFPLENLILVENMRSRTSQLTRSGGTLYDTRELHELPNRNYSKNRKIERKKKRK